MATSLLNKYNKRLSRGITTHTADYARDALEEAGFVLTKKGLISEKKSFSGLSDEERQAKLKSLDSILPSKKADFIQKYSTTSSVFEMLLDEYYDFTVKDGKVKRTSSGGYGESMQNALSKAKATTQQREYWEDKLIEFAKKGNAKTLTGEEVQEALDVIGQLKKGIAVWDEQEKKWTKRR